MSQLSMKQKQKISKRNYAINNYKITYKSEINEKILKKKATIEEKKPFFSSTTCPTFEFYSQFLPFTMCVIVQENYKFERKKGT